MHRPVQPDTVQSALLLQKTVFTHSDGSEFGEDDGYEQTSMSVAVDGRSVVFTQHCACVSFVRQLVPAHLFDLREDAANGSAVPSLTTHVLVKDWTVAPAQLNCLVSLER